jgi:hypothetical protein
MVSKWFSDGPKMVPGGPHMVPDGPNIVPNVRNMVPDGPHMIRDGPYMVPDGPRMVPYGSNMAPNGSNMVPDDSNIWVHTTIEVWVCGRHALRHRKIAKTTVNPITLRPKRFVKKDSIAAKLQAPPF